LDINNLFGYTYSRDYSEREEIQSYFGRRTVVFGVAVNLWYWYGEITVLRLCGEPSEGVKSFGQLYKTRNLENAHEANPHETHCYNAVLEDFW